jgi:glutathione transport system ATP-binding protein
VSQIISQSSPLSVPTLPDEKVLSVRNLSVRFEHEGQAIDAVRDLSFEVNRGETLAIVGESGSGKSVTSLALMRLVEQGGGVLYQGKILFRRRKGEVIDLTRSR